MTYTAYIERHTGDLRRFEDARDVMQSPTSGDVHVVTSGGARLKVPGGRIIRLKHSDETPDSETN